MAKYRIQVYNQDMTSLVWEDVKGFERTEQALVWGYDIASTGHDIIIVMKQSDVDNRCWKKIAKFY